jgi:TolB-like protein/DNA-binding winged helix-turn-helix (wHTH) protein/tetratricopeptide (TPR) repeat protein
VADIRFEAFEVDLRAGELRQHGRKIKLQQQPFRVLALLLEHPGAVVTREQLRQALWPDAQFGSFDEGLDATIHKLRTALGDSAEHPRFVETLPRRGYRFIAATDSAMAPAPPAPPMPAASSRRRVLMIVGGAFAGVVLLLSSGGLRERLRGGPVAPRISSIAVLPFVNLSGDSAQDYFAAGMTEALVTTLGKTLPVRVISNTSAMHFKGTHLTMPEIGRQLHVDAVIEGAVLRVGNRVRVTPQLVVASTDRHVWAETYERDLRDVLGLQDEIARAVANEIQVRLSGSQEGVASMRTLPVDPDAYDQYLRGRADLFGRTEQGIRRSIQDFQLAIQHDSTYAPAWAGLSDAYQFMGQFSYLPPQVAWPKAKAAARRAIEHDERLSEAHVSLAPVLLHEGWSRSGAERELRRAIVLNPSNAWAHQAYGYFLSARGRFDSALVEMHLALDLDPLAPNKQNSLAATYYRAGRYDDALRYFRQIPDPDATSEFRHRRIAAIYERQGKLTDAVAEWLVALRLGGKEAVARSVDHTFRASGFGAAKLAYLRGELQAAQRRVQGGYPRPPSFDIAADYALLGDGPRALQWLERAFREQEGSLLFLAVDDRFAALRSDARFRDLERRVGLPQDPSD